MSDGLGERGALAAIFLHYFGGSARSWTEVVDGLDGHLRCVAPDLHGFGENRRRRGDPSAPGAGYAVDDYADDVAALIAALGLGDYILVGHSMGGKIALALAARRPTGLRALLLLAPSPPTPEPIAEDKRAWLLATHGERAAALQTIGDVTYDALTPALLERAVEDNLRTAPAAWRAWLERGSRENITDRMGEIRVPVTVLLGANDPVMPRPLMERVARELGGVFRIESEAGHLLPLESPNTVVRALREQLITMRAALT